MAVMTIAICDEIRKDAQKLSRQLSTLVPDAEILVYRSRQGFLDGLSQDIRSVIWCSWDWTAKMGKAWRLYGQ